MTEKRFTIKEFSTLDAMSSLDVICDNGIELPSSTACDLLNELSDENEQLKSYIRTLGIGISKIMQSIKDDREEKALIMCLELLKKLEEEELLE